MTRAVAVAFVTLFAASAVGANAKPATLSCSLKLFACGLKCNSVPRQQTLTFSIDPDAGRIDMGPATVVFAPSFDADRITWIAAEARDVVEVNGNKIPPANREWFYLNRETLALDRRAGAGGADSIYRGTCKKLRLQI